MSRNLAEHVVRRKRKNGRVDLYFWLGRTGDPWIRIHEEPNTPEYHERVSILLKKGRRIVGVKKAPPVVLESGEKPREETFRWLCVQYYKSVDCHLKREKPLLDEMCREPVAPKDKRTFADLPLSKLTTKELKVLRDRKVKAVSEAKPKGLIGASRSRVKVLRRLCKWARSEYPKLFPVNPALELVQVKNKSQGHEPWTQEEIDRYIARWPRGTMANLALLLMLHCGLAKVDAIHVGPKNRTEWKGKPLLAYKRQKTGVEGHPPMPKELLDALAATPHGTTHYLVTEYGRPFTSSASFGNKFADWASKAGVKKTPHGLRVTCAIRYAESGCTAHQLMSIMAWASIKEAEEYCRKAARQTMAAAAGGLLLE